MSYKEYNGFTKCYVVVHNTGFGVMESPYIEKEVVFETNLLHEAEIKAKELTAINNSPDCGSWKENTYHVNINTLNELGKLMERKFEQDFNKMIKEGMDAGALKVTKIGDMTFYSPKNSIF